MEIYQLSKYENISERLKRLASNASSSTGTSAESFQGYGARNNQYAPAAKKDNLSMEVDSRAKYMENLKYSKFTTLETEYRPQELPESRINELKSPRESKGAIYLQRQRKSINTRTFEYQTEPAERATDKSLTWKNSERTETSPNDNSKVLAKVKSDGNLKVDEILESFNNYKQNKQKFLSFLGKSSANTDRFEQNSRLQEQKEEAEDRKKFKPIDNIWNEEEDQEEKAPRFERSLKSVREGFQDLTDTLNLTSFSQTSNAERQKNFSKSKLILRNVSRYEQPQNTQKTAIKTLLSPRGPRVPGKICKNVDKTFTREGY